MDRSNVSNPYDSAVMLVELNEFDPDMLLAASARLNLRNIPRILALDHSHTTTDDEIEHQGLDPWVQWVSVHSGIPSSVHNIKRLGATTKQSAPPIWSLLGARGFTWGVWGAMNAPRGPVERSAFFFPDPWSFDEEAYPAELNDLLQLPRYMSKNYLEIDRGKTVAKGLRFMKGLLRPEAWPVSSKFAANAMSKLLFERRSVHAFASCLDYLSASYFLELRRKHRPHFSLIFLNLVAHLQHQFWNPDGPIHPEMEIGLRLTDKILGDLFDDLQEGEAFILMNGLKQKNVSGKGVNVYRQRDPDLIMKWLELEYDRVEQCMTHDAQILFQNVRQADEAARRLEASQLADGTKVFFVERLEPLRVFYQIDFDHAVTGDEQLVSGNLKGRLGDLIELYAVRTGAHIPEGDVYSRGIKLPAKFHNHEVSHFIQQYFGIQSSEARARPVVSAS